MYPTISTLDLKKNTLLNAGCVFLLLMDSPSGFHHPKVQGCFNKHLQGTIEKVVFLLYFPLNAGQVFARNHLRWPSGRSWSAPFFLGGKTHGNDELPKTILDIKSRFIMVYHSPHQLIERQQNKNTVYNTARVIFITKQGTGTDISVAVSTGAFVDVSDVTCSFTGSTDANLCVEDGRLALFLLSLQWEKKQQTEVSRFGLRSLTLTQLPVHITCSSKGMDAKTATQNPISHLKHQSSQIFNHQSESAWYS